MFKSLIFVGSMWYNVMDDHDVMTSHAFLRRHGYVTTLHVEVIPRWCIDYVYLVYIHINLTMLGLYMYVSHARDLESTSNVITVMPTSYNDSKVNIILYNSNSGLDS